MPARHTLSVPYPKRVNTYIICTRDGEFIADRVTRQQINRLCGYTEEGRALARTTGGDLVFGPRLISAHKKRDYLYIALVDAAVIRAELLREFSENYYGAEDNKTTSKDFFSNEKGAGWCYKHNCRAKHYQDGRGGARTFDAGFRGLKIIVRTGTIQKPVRPPLQSIADVS